jgi:hypothetical protein
MSERVAKRAIRDWVCREHQKYWQSTPGQRHAKSFIPKLSAKRSEEILKLNRHQARRITGLLTGHCHLKGLLFKLRIVNSLMCRQCHEKEETASHVLCECEALD